MEGLGCMAQPRSGVHREGTIEKIARGMDGERVWSAGPGASSVYEW